MKGLHRHVRAGILLVSALGASSAHAAETQRYVLIIANNQSLDKGVKPLRYADDDGVRYYELFKLSTDNVALFTVLDDETARQNADLGDAIKPPSARAIFATLKRWNEEMAAHQKAGRKTELYFIYAGHGDRDKSGEGYVSLLHSKLRRRDLYRKILAPSKATYVHLIIDACKSYFLVNRRGGSDGYKKDDSDDSHDAEIRAFLEREALSAYPNAGVILATSGDQATHEWSRYRGGILSHELRSAISGAADINGDGRVEYSELHAFIAAANARVKHPEARLNIFAHAPAANRRQPLIDLRDASKARLLRFDRSLAGRYSLEDDRGVRAIDLNKSAGVRFDVAVDRRRSYYLRRANKQAQIPAGNRRVLVASLSFRNATSAARAGSLDRTFRRDLYRLAYSRGFYEGFCAQTGHLPVNGKATEFLIRRGDDDDGETRHALSAGYIASSALLDLPGTDHGAQLRYTYDLHRYLTLGVIAEYGSSSHDVGKDAFRLDRIAMLAAASGRLPLSKRLTFRIELGLGYQGYFVSGPMTIQGRRVEGSDPAGFRLEAGIGLQMRLSPIVFADLRGGLTVEAVTLEPKEYVDTSPYGAIALGARF